MVTTAYFTRHAESMGNISEFFQGRTDCEVSQKGYKQLVMIAERFKDIPLEAVYSSPLKRTLATAEAVNKYHGLDIIIDERLIEIDGGIWEGQLWSEFPAIYPKEYDLWQNRMHDFAIQDGESMRDVFDRMKNAVTDIISKNKGRTIAIISHGCALRNYLCFANSDPINKLDKVGWSDNTAVSLIEYDNGLNPHIKYKNDSSHLTAELSTLAFSAWCKVNGNGEYMENSSGK